MSSYGQILRASALIGGATAVNLAVGLMRTKALALLLGPAGIGLIGIFTSIADVARSVAQLGINGSGVRQIAEAVASGDEQRVARTVIVLRRTAIVLGLLGMAGLIACSRPVSVWAFGSADHASPIAWLSVAVFFRLVADGQAALFQGMRRIGDLARVGMLGALAGSMVSVALAAWLGEAGVVPGLVAAAALAMVISWWTARRVYVPPLQMTASQVRSEAGHLLKLGLAFMTSAILMTAAAFTVRAIVMRAGGLDAAGLYQAAWTLGGMYVGFVLQAMGTDFYPRLVGVASDADASNQAVNQQAQVSLLLAGPGVIATMVLATQILAAFYSADFVAAEPVLRWICFGMALRVISWPMGYILLALNRRLLFFGAELAWCVVNVGLSWICVQRFGLLGAGIAFFVSYVFHCLMIYAIVRRLQGFRWERAIWTHIMYFVCAISTVFVGGAFVPAPWSTAAGALVVCAAVAHSLLALARLAPEVLPASVRRLLAAVSRAMERLR